MTTTNSTFSAGLGLRRGLIDEWRTLEESDFGLERRPDFIEITPENWLNMGGKFGRDLRYFTERYKVNAHGLSLSVGGPDALDEAFVKRLKIFLDEHNVEIFSEHLSYCTDGGHLYDLMPIPFTQAAIAHTAERILRVQDLLGRRLAVENVSYYAAPGAEMSELEFINGVLDAADCDLLLDINNVYVNSVNHRYDPVEFICGLPADRIVYQHIAGHLQQSEDLIIDTHGAPVIDPVWALFADSIAVLGPRPTVLERDFNLPPMKELLAELAVMHSVADGKHQSFRVGSAS